MAETNQTTGDPIKKNPFFDNIGRRLAKSWLRSLKQNFLTLTETGDSEGIELITTEISQRGIKYVLGSELKRAYCLGKLGDGVETTSQAVERLTKGGILDEDIALNGLMVSLGGFILTPANSDPDRMLLRVNINDAMCPAYSGYVISGEKYEAKKAFGFDREKTGNPQNRYHTVFLGTVIGPRDSIEGFLGDLQESVGDNVPLGPVGKLKVAVGAGKIATWQGYNPISTEPHSE